MTSFGKHAQRSVRSLTEEAVRDALADAGAEPDVVDHAFFSNAVAGLITGQACIPGQSALRHTGLLAIPIVNVENACASGSTAFGLARATLASGAADVAIVVGAEKLSHPDKRVSFAAFEGGYDRDEPPSAAQNGAGTGSVFMDIYAQMTRDYMARSGVTEEDFAAVAVKAHDHGALNPKAQYGDQVTIEDVLASRTISDPLRLLMCSPIGDGAAALVLATARGLERLDADPVRVLATSLGSGRGRHEGGTTAPEREGQRAYAEAGIQPSDVDVVELHDAASPAELVITEELGLCPPGGGVEFLRS